MSYYWISQSIHYICDVPTFSAFRCSADVSNGNMLIHFRFLCGKSGLSYGREEGSKFRSIMSEVADTFWVSHLKAFISLIIMSQAACRLEKTHCSLSLTYNFQSFSLPSTVKQHWHHWSQCDFAVKYYRQKLTPILKLVDWKGVGFLQVACHKVSAWADLFSWQIFCFFSNYSDSDFVRIFSLLKWKTGSTKSIFTLWVWFCLFVFYNFSKNFTTDISGNDN